MSLNEIAMQLAAVQETVTAIRLELQTAISDEQTLLQAIEAVSVMRQQLDKAVEDKELAIAEKEQLFNANTRNDRARQYWLEKYQQLNGAVMSFHEAAERVFDK